MLAKATRASDYLDWFEITRARETSGVFEDYLRLKQRLLAQPHSREDPLSKYLDHMNSIFSRKTDEPPATLPPRLPLGNPADAPIGQPSAAPVDLPKP